MLLKGMTMVRVLFVFFFAIVCLLAAWIIIGELTGSSFGLKNILNSLLCVGC